MCMKVPNCEIKIAYGLKQLYICSINSIWKFNKRKWDSTPCFLNALNCPSAIQRKLMIGNSGAGAVVNSERKIFPRFYSPIIEKGILSVEPVIAQIS